MYSDIILVYEEKTEDKIIEDEENDCYESCYEIVQDRESDCYESSSEHFDYESFRSYANFDANQGVCFFNSFLKSFIQVCRINVVNCYVKVFLVTKPLNG